MIAVSEVEIALGGNKLLVAESFEISKGLWALVGRNGSGKSTFLNAILQSKNILSGALSLNGVAISEYTSMELAKLMSVVYTKPEIFGNFTVKEVIELGRLPYGNAFGALKEADYQICENAVQVLNIQQLQSKQFTVLSDGEKQLVMIARALAQNTPMIILDEPTAFLDVVNRNEIIKILKNISVNQGKTILFSTHDVALIPELCDGLLYIHQEKLKCCTVKADFGNIIEYTFSE